MGDGKERKGITCSERLWFFSSFGLKMQWYGFQRLGLKRVWILASEIGSDCLTNRVVTTSKGTPTPSSSAWKILKMEELQIAVKIILLRRAGGGGGRYYFPLMMFVEPAMKGGLKFWVWMNFLCSYENDRNTIGPYSLLLKQYKKSTKWFILTWNYCRGTMEGAAEIEPSSCLSHNFLL